MRGKWPWAERGSGHATFKNVVLAYAIRMINVLLDCLQDHEITCLTHVSCQSYEKNENNISINLSATAKLAT